MFYVTIESMFLILISGALWGGFIGWHAARSRANRDFLDLIQMARQPDPDATPLRDMLDMGTAVFEESRWMMVET